MDQVSKKLYTIVYCSHNRIGNSPEQVKAELDQILAASRRNNAPAGVTGALLYNNGCFAQILEGPLAAVERIFERIQQDPRHSDVAVIQSGFAEERQFPDWSMAFIGSAQPEALPAATAALDAVFANAADAGEQMLNVLRDLVVDEGEWITADSCFA